MNATLEICYFNSEFNIILYSAVVAQPRVVCQKWQHCLCCKPNSAVVIARCFPLWILPSLIQSLVFLSPLSADLCDHALKIPHDEL